MTKLARMALLCAITLPISAEEIVTKDTLITGNTATVITTVCLPICSSYARVYTISGDEKWYLEQTIMPDSTKVFSQAFFDHDTIRWQDNTPQILDEEGK